MSYTGTANAPPPYKTDANDSAAQNGRTTETFNDGPQIEVVQNVAPPPMQQVTPLNLLRERPEDIYCPKQGKIVKTRAESKDSDKTWFAVLGICLICPCAACIPLKGCCGDGMFQDFDQYCEGCGKQLTHRPYNHEAQILAPDHDVTNNAAQGWQVQPQVQQMPQMYYMPQQQPKPQ